MSYSIAQIREFRKEVKRLKPLLHPQDSKTYETMRDSVIVSFLPYASDATQMAEKIRYKAYLSTNNSHLESILYGEIWDDLLPNERLSIEHLYYEAPAMVARGTKFYDAIHAYTEAKRHANSASATQHLRHALWEIMYHSPFQGKNALEHDNAKRRRKAQATMLNSLNISLSTLPTPTYISEPIRQHYRSMSLEALLPDIVFPLHANARAIAEEIQNINAEIQRQILGQKSAVSDAQNSVQANDAFVELTTKIVEDVRPKIEAEITAQAQQGKTEAEIVAHVENVIEHYQDTVIPQKTDLLATHFNGKLTELNQREAGYNYYIWHAQDDTKVRPSHTANDGKIFAWDNPPPTGNPGEDYNCRCYAQPYRDPPSDINDPPIEPVYPEAFLIPAWRLRSIMAAGLKQIGDAVAKVRKPQTPSSVKKPESLRGSSFKETERTADRELLSKGWKKEPLRDGNGIRYTDGKGGSFEINRGYPKSTGGDKIHKGGYIKTTVGNKKIWIPLKNNPSLQ